MSLVYLTGPPRIGAVLAPTCTERPDLVWDPSESTTRTLRDGTVETVRARLRGRVVLVWAALERATHLALRYELSRPGVLVSVRTRAPGDPDYAAELPLAMRLAGPIGSTADLRTGLASLEAELVTTRLYAEPPDLALVGQWRGRALTLDYSDHTRGALLV
jgi:hypothetical protein